MREVKLDSGAVLKVAPAPFADAKALYQAILRELKNVPMSRDTEAAEMFKSFFCNGFSSPEVEQRLWVCLVRCQYNNGAGDLKIDASTFESVAAREDYMAVCMEVVKENVLPFGKGLYAEWRKALSMIDNIPASRPQTTSS